MLSAYHSESTRMHNRSFRNWCKEYSDRVQSTRKPHQNQAQEEHRGEAQGLPPR
ncbi:hypothetical protein BRADI_3g07503v3 [Brachypodium distachyon]|uniref:Uncharacterized protein n=1 Tax=Brachypodium distachyon TaxID=15368 RepID=A0A2K2CVS3_BRADI|nr:hypothetical protein BRADI_3g07503v3 [Brachypodium distachyon]